MVATLPAALGAALVACVLEESPHSLASRGHAKEAAHALASIARRNGLSTPPPVPSPRVPALRASQAQREPREATRDAPPLPLLAGHAEAVGGAAAVRLVLQLPAAAEGGEHEAGASCRRLLQPPARPTTLTLGVVWAALSFGWCAHAYVSARQAQVQPLASPRLLLENVTFVLEPVPAPRPHGQHRATTRISESAFILGLEICTIPSVRSICAPR